MDEKHLSLNVSYLHIALVIFYTYTFFSINVTTYISFRSDRYIQHYDYGYCNLTHLTCRRCYPQKTPHWSHPPHTSVPSPSRRTSEPPQCLSCNCALTVVHIILECQQYNSVRQKYFSVTIDRVNFDDILF